MGKIAKTIAILAGSAVAFYLAIIAVAYLTDDPVTIIKYAFPWLGVLAVVFAALNVRNIWRS